MFGDGIIFIGGKMHRKTSKIVGSIKKEGNDYNLNKLKEGIKFSGSIKRQFSIITVIMIMLTSISLSLIAYNKSSEMLVQNLGKRALSIAKGSAQEIDIYEHESIKSKEDMEGEPYIGIKEKLHSIKNMSGTKFIYTIRRDSSGRFSYVVDASGEESSEVGAYEDGYDEIFSRVYGLNEGYVEEKIDVTDDYGALVTAYYPLKDSAGSTVGILGVDYGVDDEYNSIKNLKYSMILFSILIAAVASALAAAFSIKIAGPITKVASAAEKVSKYDVSIDRINDSQGGEVGTLASSINVMVENMRGLLSNIKDTTSNLSNIADTIEDSCTSVNDSSVEIAASIEEIAAGVSSQASDAMKSVDMGEELAGRIEGIQRGLETAVENAKVMKENNETGKDSILQMEEKFFENKQASEEVSRSIERLSESSKYAGSIVDAIRKIASQTNLLALNASIEAARAGEHGRGFAVVAQEVGALAGQSEESVGQIEEIITNMLSVIEYTAVRMEKSQESFDSMDEYVKSTISSFESINLSADELISRISILGKDIEMVSSAKDTVIESIVNTSRVSEESSAAIEEMSAATEQQSYMMEDIVSKAYELNDIVKKLSTEMDRFKLE